jgi:hypothetical protein
MQYLYEKLGYGAYNTYNRTGTMRTVFIFFSPGELSDLSRELYLPYPRPSPFYFV